MKNLNLDNKKLILVPFIALGLVFFSSSFAQTVSSDLPEGTTQAQITSALNELSAVYGKTVANVDEARDICNSEQFLVRCAEIGQRHDLYHEEELSQVNTLLNEIKGDVSAKLAGCTTAECLLDVAKELAGKVAGKDSQLAAQLDLTSRKVEEKRAVVQAAKEAGVDFQACRTMDPDSAPVDLLRACARLAKDDRVGKFISQEAKEGIRSLDSTLVLRDSLEKKEFSCGDGTLEGCGDFCLNPATTARAQGVAAIPPVCRQIAEKFFGSDGIKSLEAAYQNVNSAADYYNKKAQHTVFTTQDGKTLTDPAEIGRYMEAQGRLGNVEAVGKGLDFMVSNGFVSSEEKEFALKMVNNFRDRGGPGVDFDACHRNPEACADFIPEEFRGEFDSANKIKDIMSQKLGFDPRECDTSDESVIKRCFEATSNALPELDALPTKSREVQRMIDEMREHTRRDQAFDQSRQSIQQQGGPGGCRSPQECFAYCSDTAHGPECLSFGAKSGIFKGDDVIKRYQEYNYRLEAPKFSGPQHGDFTGTGPYPGFQPPGQEGYLPPGQIPGFTQPGPGFGSQPGPSPECFKAIQSGNFARAKEVCSVPSIPQPIEFQPTVCPAMPTVTECPAGQVRYVTYSSPQCGEYYSCKSSGDTQCPSGQYWDGTKCMAYNNDPSADCTRVGGVWDATTYYCKMPGTNNCSPGQYFDYNTKTCVNTTPPSGQKEQFWNTLGLRSWIRADANSELIEKLKQACANVPSGANVWMPGAGDYSSPDFGMPSIEKCQKAASCTSNQQFDGTNCVSSPYTGCPAGQYKYTPPDGGTSYCKSTTPTDCPFGYHWVAEPSNTAGGYCAQDSTGGTGCGSYTNQASCVGASSIKCDWRSSGSSGWCQASTGTASCGNYICESGETTSCSADCQGSTSAETCGNHYCGSGETSVSCPSDCSSSTTTGGTGCGSSTAQASQSACLAAGNCRWDNNACSSATSTTPCPSGQWWNGTACVTSTPTDCPSGQYWYTPPSGGTGYCMSSTTTTTCPSGQHMEGGACVADSTNTTTTTCPSGQHMEGGACVADSTTTTTTSTPPPSTTTDPATSCTKSGGNWDSSSSTCKFPPSTLNINFFLAQISQILKDLFNLIGNSGSVR